MATTAILDAQFAAEYLDGGGEGVHILHPKYGAKWDVTNSYITNAHLAFDNALDDIATRFKGRGTIMTSPGLELRFEQPHTIPDTLADGCEVEYRMTGAKLRSLGGADIFRRMPANQTNANNYVGARFFVRGGYWEGDSATAGQAAIRLGATYGTIVEGVYVIGFDYGVDLLFSMLAEIRNSRATFCRKYGVSLRSGIPLGLGATGWTGADSTNSGSNGSAITLCRSYASPGTEAQFAVIGSDSCEVNRVIAEGFNSVDNVLFDYQGGTTVKDFTLRGLHSENTPTNAAVHLKSSGISIVEGVFHQSPGPVLVDTTGSTGQAVTIVRAIPWNPGGMKMKQGAGSWHFEFMSSWDGLAKANWVGDAVPTGTSQIRKAAGNYTRIGGDFLYLDGTVVPEKLNTGFNGRLIGIGGQLGADTVDAGTMAPGAIKTKDTAIFGAKVGDIISVSFGSVLPDGVHGWAQVMAEGSPAPVRIYLKNDSAVSQVVGFVNANLALFRAG